MQPLQRSGYSYETTEKYQLQCSHMEVSTLVVTSRGGQLVQKKSILLRHFRNGYDVVGVVVDPDVKHFREKKKNESQHL